MSLVEGRASSAPGSQAKPLKGRVKRFPSTSAAFGSARASCQPSFQQVVSLVSTKAARLDNLEQEKPAPTLHFRLEREKSSHLGSEKHNWQLREHSRLLRPSCCSIAAHSKFSQTGRLVEWNLSRNSRRFHCQLFVVGDAFVMLRLLPFEL